MDIINTEKDTYDLDTTSGQYGYVCEYLVAHGARGDILSCMEKMFLKAQENARLREALEKIAYSLRGNLEKESCAREALSDLRKGGE